jgi:hypothetical protein
MPSDSDTQLRTIALSTAFMCDENGGIMSIVCVFRELEPDHGKRRSADKAVKDVVEELAERLRMVLRMKEDKDDKDDKREEGEVG